MRKLLLLSLICIFPLQTLAQGFSRELKSMNNNVFVYQGGKKIEALTTRGNVSQECDYPTHNPCIGYGIVKNTGTYGIVLRWINYDGTENKGPDIFLYDFQKGGGLKLVTAELDKKYHVKDLGNWYMTQDGANTTIIATITAERYMTPEQAKSYGYILGKNTGTKEYPIYKNATISIPSSYFKSILANK